MGANGWRLWSALVQGAAFIAAAGLVATLFALFGGNMIIYYFVFPVLLVLAIPFGLLPYAIARKARKVRWRHAAIAGALAGSLFGVVVFFGTGGRLLQ